jgi:excisionase family DNA binding protein
LRLFLQLRLFRVTAKLDIAKLYRHIMARVKPSNPYNPTPRAISLASEAARVVKEMAEHPPETITFTCIDSDSKDAKITIPGESLRLLADLFDKLGQGEAVVLMSQTAEISTQEAAELLNVSRPYVVKLLDEGKIPFRKVGIYRRVKLQDVIVYRQAEQQRQSKILDELTKEAQDLDLGY